MSSGVALMQWDAISASATVIVPVAGLLWLVIGQKTRQIVREDNDRLLSLINGTYVRSAGSRLTGYDVERRLEWIEERIDMRPRHPHEPR